MDIVLRRIVFYFVYTGILGNKTTDYISHCKLCFCRSYILLTNVFSFGVRLTKQVKSLAKNERVVFGTVDLNEGKGYNPSTGIFTAPSDGTCVFDWTTMTYHGAYSHTSLVINGNFKSWNHCNDGLTKTYVTCSKMTVVKLKQGDKAWIGVLLGPAGLYEQYTSFSGYKL